MCVCESSSSSCCYCWVYHKPGRCNVLLYTIVVIHVIISQVSCLYYFDMTSFSISPFFISVSIVVTGVPVVVAAVVKFKCFLRNICHAFYKQTAISILTSNIFLSVCLPAIISIWISGLWPCLMSLLKKADDGLGSWGDKNFIETLIC